MPSINNAPGSSPDIKLVQGEPTVESIQGEIDATYARIKLLQGKENPDTEFIQFLSEKMRSLQDARDTLGTQGKRIQEKTFNDTSVWAGATNGNPNKDMGQSGEEKYGIGRKIA
jgi:hypothetical protein